MDGWLSCVGRIDTLHRASATCSLIGLPADMGAALATGLPDA